MKHVKPVLIHYDFNERRAILMEGSEDSRMTLTSIHGFTNMVASATEYEGQWPVVGGIRGDELSVKELIALGEKILGPFSIEKVKPEDLKAGIVKTTWRPRMDHPAFPPHLVDQVGEGMVAGLILGLAAEAFKVSDEWNNLLPDLKLTSAEAFLTEAWHGKP